MAVFQGSQAIRDSSVRHPLLDNLIQVLIPKLREQFAFCCVPPHNSGGLDQSLYESWVRRSWGHRSFLPGLCVNVSPGNSMELLSGPLHRDCLARILSGFGLLFIFWPRFVFPAVSCLTYCLCQVCWQKNVHQTTLYLELSPGSEGDKPGVWD